MNEIISGLFVLGGTLIGSAITYFSSREEKNWKKIKSHVSLLTDQLLAYNKLEEIYSQKLSETNSKDIAPITIKIKMRDEVAAMEEYHRPEITPARIKSIRSRWL